MHSNWRNFTMEKRILNKLAEIYLMLTLGAAFLHAKVQGQVFSPPSGAPSAFAVQPDGKILANGLGQPLSLLDSSGAVDASFSANINGTVSSMILQNDGKWIVTGDFTQVGGVSRTHLARINADGSLDASFAPILNGNVLGAAMQPNGKLVVGGDFTTVNGVARGRIARLETDGTLDVTFDPSADGSMDLIVLQPDNKVMVTGDFTAIGGGSRSAIARLNADGSLDTGFTAPAGTVASCLALQPNGKILLATVEASPKILRLEADGSLDSGFNSYDFSAAGSKTGYTITSITLDCRSYLWVTCSAGVYDGGSIGGYCLLSPNGSLGGRTELYKFFDYTAGGILANGNFLASGNSVSVTNQPTWYPIWDMVWAPWAPTNSLSFNNSRVRWLRGETAPEAAAVTFDLSLDGGVTWGFLGDGSRIAGGWELSGLVLPSTGMVRGRAAVLSGEANMSRGIVEYITTITPPEILVRGGSSNVEIASGDVTPSSEDWTLFPPRVVSREGGGSRGYSITNTGTTVLTVSDIQISGLNAAEFSVNPLSLPLNIGANEKVSFSILHDPATLGIHNATVTLTSNDADEGTYTFAIQGEGIEPQIAVNGNGATIAAGDDTPSATDGTAFGTLTSYGTSVTRTFTIENTGLTDLKISGITMASGSYQFAVGGITFPANIAPGTSTTFTLSFTKGVAGLNDGLVSIISNSAQASAFYFWVNGTAYPEIEIEGNGILIPDGDTTPSVMDGTDMGQFKLNPSPSGHSTFSVKNTGAGRLTLYSFSKGGLGNAGISMGGGSNWTIEPGASRTFGVSYYPTTVGTQTANIMVNSNDADEATYDFTVKGQGAYRYVTGSEVLETSSAVTLATTDIYFMLGHAPAVGAMLKVVDNTGLAFINGAYTNLPHGTELTLTYDGKPYYFVADYFGGDGNDLVLHWAGSRPYGWGENANGRIGDGTSTDSFSPVAVAHEDGAALNGKTVLRIASGGSHTLALCSDGKVYAWGANDYGQLGDNSIVDRTSPVEVNSTSISALNGKTVVAIAAGFVHSLALCSDGTLVSWGYNTTGQLGDNTVTHRRVPVLVNTQTGVSALFGKTVVGIASGGSAYHSLARCSDGTLVSWGRNLSGCLGDNTNTSPRKVPVAVHTATGLAAKQVKSIATGLDFSMALTTDGQVFNWGENGYSQLGAYQGAAYPTTDVFHPVIINALTTGIQGIGAGETHGMYLRANGVPCVWGRNNYKQIGNPILDSNAKFEIPHPVQVDAGSALEGKSVVAISAGENHCYALCSDGTLAAWGRNNVGLLGLGATTPASSSTPMLVSDGEISSGQKILQVAAGLIHTQVLVASPTAILSVEQPVNNVLVDGSSSVNFGNVFEDTFHYKTFTVRNIGYDTLGGIKIAPPTGTHAIDFVVSAAAANSVAPGETTTFTVGFKPTVLGVRNAVIRVSANALNAGLPVDIAVTGTGVATSMNLVFNSAEDVPIHAPTFTVGSKTVTLTLNHLPVPGEELRVVNMTGTALISGFFSNLPQQQVIALTHNGQSYNFYVTYHGGDGNDLVLRYLDLELNGHADTDGVTNFQEFMDGTDPHDELSYLSPVVWAEDDLNGTEPIAGNTGGLKKVVATTVSADAVADRKLIANGRVTFKAQAASVIAVGLNLENTAATAADLDYRIQTTSTNTAQVYEGSVAIAGAGVLGAYTVNTVFAIERVNGEIRYYKDGVLRYTSLLRCAGPLLLDTYISTLNHTIPEVRFTGGDLDNDQMADSWERTYLPANADLVALQNFKATDDLDKDRSNNLQEFIYQTNANDKNHYLEQVSWKNHVNTVGLFGPVSKVTNVSAFDADAVSKRSFTNVSLSFRASTKGIFAIGINAANLARTKEDLNFAIVLTNGVAQVFENPAGTSQSPAAGALGTFGPHTVFTIRRNDATVTYWKDGELKYTSTHTATGTYVVDTAFSTPRASVLDARYDEHDGDDDGMTDSWEVYYGLNPNLDDADSDADDDGLTNGEESSLALNPRSKDTDGDLLPDKWEVDYALNPKSPTNQSDTYKDPDEDDLNNLAEYEKGTYPQDPDSDDDLMPDGWEVRYELDPQLTADAGQDADSDGLTNLVEFNLGTNPRRNDSDNDSLPDKWEVDHSMNPVVYADAFLDHDGDGILTYLEYRNGTNPFVHNGGGSGSPVAGPVPTSNPNDPPPPEGRIVAHVRSKHAKAFTDPNGKHGIFVPEGESVQLSRFNKVYLTESEEEVMEASRTAVSSEETADSDSGSRGDTTWSWNSFEFENITASYSERLYKYLESTYTNPIRVDPSDPANPPLDLYGRSSENYNASSSYEKEYNYIYNKINNTEGATYANSQTTNTNIISYYRENESIQAARVGNDPIFPSGSVESEAMGERETVTEYAPNHFWSKNGFTTLTDGSRQNFSDSNNTSNPAASSNYSSTPITSVKKHGLSWYSEEEVKIVTPTTEVRTHVLKFDDEKVGEWRKTTTKSDELPWIAVDARMRAHLEAQEFSPWAPVTSLSSIGTSEYLCNYHPYQFISEANVISWYLHYEIPQGLTSEQVAALPPVTKGVFLTIKNPQGTVVEQKLLKTVTIQPGETSVIEETKALDAAEGPTAPLPDGGSISVSLMPISLAIDANRDGTIASGETATQAKPFRFWINNDDDPNTLGNDVEAAMKEDELSPPDFEDWRSAPTLGHIDGVRDLEDFTRLHLTLPPDIVEKAKAGEVQVGFKWTEGNGPRIRVYKAQEGGGQKYLFYKYEANLQVDSDHQKAVADVKGSQTEFLPSSYWQGIATGTSKLNFIFEGCEKGTAKLTTVIKSGSSAEIEGAGVWIKLMDVQEMFERGKVAPPMSEPDDVPAPWVTTEPLVFQATPDPNSNGFQADPDETKQYIIHVHGWRMSYHEAQTWANTSFKRLWHLGYKGRYAFFSWPTFSGATSAFGGYLTYNNSEYRAWLSGAALKAYVASLPDGYTKNIMAHSMGNVVVGSAFRQGMDDISNYALFNAAMAAQSYDPTRIDFPNRQTPDTDSDPTVQARFGLSSKFSGITARVTNFYLEDDFATIIWGDNHEWNKPQRFFNEVGGVIPVERAYGYSNSGWNVDESLHKLVQLDPIVETFPLRGITMTEEAMAYVSQTRSLPAGRTPTNLGFTGGGEIDMDTHAFENNLRFFFGSEHSAVWIWSLQRTFGAWRELLYSFDITPNPVP